MADKAQCKAVGEAVVGLIAAVKDGVDVTDVSVLIALGTKVAAVADDLKEDTDAAVAYIVAGLTEAYGDSKVGP